MTIELIKILSDFHSWIEDWNAGAIPTEQEFVDKIKELNKRFSEELRNQKVQEILAS